MDKKKRFREITQKIKSIQIQGARNIAKAALYAYSLIPTKESKQTLLSLRPTEPMLVNVLNKVEKFDETKYKKILKHFDEAQNEINKRVYSLIKNEDVIFTHCHSTNVINALIYSKKQGKRFEVYNTETRPLFQGRQTALDLSKEGIKVTQFVDSAVMIALTEKKKVNKVFLGADALLKEGIINKVGSGMFSKIAFDNKIPVYIIADSWKFSKKNVKVEERNFREVWKKTSIKIRNPAFEFVPKKYIEGIISEIGTLSYSDFLRKMR